MTSDDSTRPSPRPLPRASPLAATTKTIATAKAPADDAGSSAGSLVIPVFRVVSQGLAGTAFSGEENRSGGRWSSPGVPAVYASTSPAGAVLEFLAHIDGEKPVDIALVSARMPGRCVAGATDLPVHWRETPYRDDVREYGNRWIKSARSLALALPSVLCERSINLLINPGHEDIAQLIVDHVEPFTLDPRLL